MLKSVCYVLALTMPALELETDAPSNFHIEILETSKSLLVYPLSDTQAHFFDNIYNRMSCYLI